MPLSSHFDQAVIATSLQAYSVPLSVLQSAVEHSVPHNEWCAPFPAHHVSTLQILWQITVFFHFAIGISAGTGLAVVLLPNAAMGNSSTLGALY